MRKQNFRTVKWCEQRQRAYVVRDGVRYWAPQDTTCASGDEVNVFSPDMRSVYVKHAGLSEIWNTGTTSPASGG